MDEPKPVVIMLDGMDDTPIAIPFPFEIGEFTIRNPVDWHWFKCHYEGLIKALNEDDHE